VETAPRSYRLVVPDSWFRIPLGDEKERQAAARALTDRVFRGIDHTPRLRTRLLGGLNDQAAAARAAGGLELYMSMLEAAGFPLSASLLVSMVAGPPAGTGGAEAARSFGAVLRGEGKQVRTGTVAGQSAVRARHRTGGVANADPGVVPVVGQDVYVLVPGGRAWLLMSFSTPIVELASQMQELFDAITGTLSWAPRPGL
jgi:hypothetical protein